MVDVNISLVVDANINSVGFAWLNGELPNVDSINALLKFEL